MLQLQTCLSLHSSEHHLRIPAFFLLSLITVADKVNKYSQKNYHTFYNILPERIDIHKIQTVVQITNDKSTDNCSAYFTCPTGHRRTTDNDSCDCIHFSSISCCRLSR